MDKKTDGGGDDCYAKCFEEPKEWRGIKWVRTKPESGTAEKDVMNWQPFMRKD